MCDKYAIIVICLLSFLVCIAADFEFVTHGVKCYIGAAKTGSGNDAYKLKQCDIRIATCMTIHCDGELAGTTVKSCGYIDDFPYVNSDDYDCFETCNVGGVETGGTCSLCAYEHGCNSDPEEEPEEVVEPEKPKPTIKRSTKKRTTSTTTTTTTKTTTTTTLQTSTKPLTTTTSDQENGLKFHHPIAIWLLIAFIGVITAVGHFLL